MATISMASVEELKQSKVGTVIRDTELRGFQAKRLVSGVAYAYEYRDGIGRKSKVRRVPLGRHGEITPKEARALAKDQARNKLNGRNPSAERSELKDMPTLAEFADAWLTEREEFAKLQPLHARPKRSTISTYRSTLHCHVSPAFGDRKLSAISHGDVVALHKTLGRTKPTVANRCVQFISSLYGHAADAGYIKRGVNPAQWVKQFEEFSRQRFLSDDEMMRLGDAIRIAETTGIPHMPRPVKPGKKSKHLATNRPNYVISATAADAIRSIALMGTRMSENLDAKWTDVDFELCFLMKHTKTGFRPILIPEAAMEIFRRMPKFSEYIFPQDSDPTRPMSDVRKQWVAVRKLAGLDGVRLHDLRHSFASVAIITGGSSLAIVGNLLGHTQARTTQRYAHIGESPARKVLEKSAGRISGAIGSRQTDSDGEGFAQ